MLGVGLGFSVTVWLRWPRWTGIAVAVVSSGMAFVRSILWRRGARDPGSDPVTQFLEVISEHRAMRRRERLLLRTWQSVDLPLLGLPPSWQGMRHLGSFEVSREGRTFELVHVGGDGGLAPRLRVEVSTDVRRLSRDRLRVLAESLWIEASEPPLGLSASEAASWRLARAREIASRSGPHWRPVKIPVADERVDFYWLSEGRMWVAHGRLGEMTVTVRGTDFGLEAVQLVYVENLDPYIEGTRLPS